MQLRNVNINSLLEHNIWEKDEKPCCTSLKFYFYLFGLIKMDNISNKADVLLCFVNGNGGTRMWFLIRKLDVLVQTQFYLDQCSNRKTSVQCECLPFHLLLAHLITNQLQIVSSNYRDEIQKKKYSSSKMSVNVT